MADWTGRRAAVPSDEDEPDDWSDAAIEAGRLALPVEIEPAVEAFTIAATQWRWTTAGVGAPMGGVILQPIRVGLDYAGMRAAWSLGGLTPTPSRFMEVRLMEAEALAALSELRSD